jgi:hypothetical protein
MKGAFTVRISVHGGERGLVLERPAADGWEPADEDAHAVGPLELRDRAPDQHVAHAGGDAHVEDDRGAGLAGEAVEEEGVLGHEGDVAAVLARLDDGAQRLEAHPAGERAGHAIEGLDEPRNRGGVGQVGLDGLQGPGLRRLRQGRLGQVGDRDLEPLLPGQLAGHHAPDPAGAEHHDALAVRLRHDPASTIETGGIMVRGPGKGKRGRAGPFSRPAPGLFMTKP